ncbi:ubiquitin-conjugating enzyme E2 K-like [Oppia nitens]|uniref:ubiquitin-conjugating enzyme E2 K-like n=1 Tax=Oppia nitens TaxID=1686743 RepID=UPI0023DBF619|nr:ubiquitin-conjugating enzyme E2 K-like [Oppia nitens]XP_054163415.1 ubiquitin-conjugating enzyme E2 K-like [Oppia nitens]
MANRRINKELIQMMSDNNIRKNHYAVELKDGSDCHHILGQILGAPGSPFEKGVFKVNIEIPAKYPFEPPVCKFQTRLWHPNISSQTGVICLDILKDQWAASMTIESVLKSLQSFLSSPEPRDPQDAVVANQYISDRNLYSKTARYWTYWYAMSDDDKKSVDKQQFMEFEDKIAMLMAATPAKCSRESALFALSCHNWDVNLALKFV